MIPALVGSLLTVALNPWEALMGMIPLTGETGFTTIAGMVMAAEPDFVVSLTEVAVRVTLRLEVGMPGAV